MVKNVSNSQSFQKRKVPNIREATTNVACSRISDTETAQRKVSSSPLFLLHSQLLFAPLSTTSAQGYNKCGLRLLFLPSLFLWVIRISALQKKNSKNSSWILHVELGRCCVRMHHGTVLGRQTLSSLAFTGGEDGVAKGLSLSLAIFTLSSPYSTLLWKTPSLRLSMGTRGRRSRHAIFIKLSVFQSKSSHVKNCFAW